MNQDNFLWVLKFPLVLSKTLYHKSVSRRRKADYKTHIMRIYSDSLFSDRSDKFSRARDRISEIAYDEGRNRSVLDIATGCGWQALSLSKRRFKRVAAVDMGSERIEFCKKNLPSKIEFTQMDASHMRFGKEEFDCSVVTAALHDMPEQVIRKVISDIARVTRKRVVVFEPINFKRRNLFSGIYAFAAGLLDESMHLHEYVFCDIDGIMMSHGWKLAFKERAWKGFMEIRVYVKGRHS
jgi:ubiquinone/menaquinone biosynthesis C-methylase UbiE